MLKELSGDLHIHTCLSPCGENEMLPSQIIEEAKRKGLNMIAICDHNSGENVFAMKKRGEKYGMGVIGGMEITSEEEVHILAFFDEDASLLKMQQVVYESLPPQKNDEELFGMQIIVDEEDNVIDINDRLLIGATRLKIKEIIDLVHDLGGLAVAAHIDREAFSIVGQLGFIPEGLELDAVEVSPLWQSRKFPLPANLPVVTSSDAHRLEEIGKVNTTFIIEEATVAEIKKAFLNQNGRRVVM